MIPIKDINPRRRFPIVTIGLIVANILVFLYEVSIGPDLERFFAAYALVPRNAVNILYGIVDLHVLITFFSSLFLHGGWAHLFGNMLYLWIFGDNVEDKMGHTRFLIFYLLCGIIASAFHILTQPLSNIPTVGASGAISGVLGAYLIMFPRARVLTLIPIFLFIQIAELSAFTLIFLWFILQFLSGMLDTSSAGGVAWWAHIGGFLAGIIFVIPFRKYR